MAVDGYLYNMNIAVDATSPEPATRHEYIEVSHTPNKTERLQDEADTAASLQRFVLIQSRR